MKRKMLLIFLGLVLAVSGLCTVDDKEMSWQAKIEQTIRTLRENGANERLVDKVIQDMIHSHNMRAKKKTEEPEEFFAELQGVEGASNTLYGTNAGIALTTGTENSFFGRTAGYKTSTGSSNSFFGFKAGYENNVGHENIFIGSRSGQSNTSGSYNLFIGKEAGLTNYNGMNNIFAGYKSGKYNTTGDENTFLGDHAGMANITGYLNTYVGSYAGYYNTDSYHNTLIGAFAGADAAQSSYNTFVGTRAGEINTGIENVFIGDWAGLTNTGSGNVFIGNEADMAGSNKLVIANSTTANPLIAGDFDLGHVGINNNSPGWMFVVGTSNAYCDGGAWVDGSSREVKENIEALTSAEALQAFAKLEPVKFNYKQDKEEPRLGFIAEDVPELVAEKGRKGLSPMDMVAMLTKVVQEQQKTLTEQQKTLAELQEKIAKLGGK